MSAFLGSGEVGAAIGVVISTTVLILNAYTKNYDLGDLVSRINYFGRAGQVNCRLTP